MLEHRDKRDNEISSASFDPPPISSPREKRIYAANDVTFRADGVFVVCIETKKIVRYSAQRSVCTYVCM